MSNDTVEDFYGKNQPCIGPECTNTNRDERISGSVRLYRHPDMGPVCPAHYSQWQASHHLTRLQPWEGDRFRC